MMVAVKKPDNEPKKTERAAEYFAGVWSELKKVNWPNRRQLMVYTGVVFFAVTLISFLMWIVDNGLGMLLSRLLA